MTQAETVFRHGKTKPTELVQLKEGSRVFLKIRPTTLEERLAWMQRVRKIREQIYEREGFLPSCTDDIAEDRMR